MSKYSVWLATQVKDDFPKWEKRAEISRRRIDSLIFAISARAELGKLIRLGYLTKSEAREYATPVRFLDFEILESLKEESNHA